MHAGFNKSKIEPKLAIAVIVVRYMILPGLGIGVVKAAAYLGLLPSDPLFHFVLMVQYTLPPAMNIGTPHFFITIYTQDDQLLINFIV